MARYYLVARRINCSWSYFILAESKKDAIKKAKSEHNNMKQVSFKETVGGVGIYTWEASRNPMR